MKNILFTSLFVLLAVSCDKSDKKNPSSTQVSEQVTQHYGYEITTSSCSSGKQNFSSITQYCEGLQDEALNNSCAQNARRSLFNRNCDGIFTIKEIKKSEALTNSKSKQERTLLPGLTLLDFPELYANNLKDPVNSTLAMFTCFSKVTDAIESKLNSILIMPGSKIYIRRDTQYVFGDGTRPKSTHTEVHFSCPEGQKDESKFEVKKIKVGESLTKEILFSPQGLSVVKHEANISCNDTYDDFVKANLNGIGMTKGTRLILYKNIKNRISSKVKINDYKKVQILICE